MFTVSVIFHRHVCGQREDGNFTHDKGTPGYTLRLKHAFSLLECDHTEEFFSSDSPESADYCKKLESGYRQFKETKKVQLYMHLFRHAMGQTVHTAFTCAFAVA